MNEMVLVVKMQEENVPTNWHTAKECRARAESWENSELKSCVDVVMEQLWATAEKGGVKDSIAIRTGRPEHFYKTFRSVMESLGYKIVNQPSDPADSSAFARYWTFAW